MFTLQLPVRNTFLHCTEEVPQPTVVRTTSAPLPTLLKQPSTQESELVGGSQPSIVRLTTYNSMDCPDAEEGCLQETELYFDQPAARRELTLDPFEAPMAFPFPMMPQLSCTELLDTCLTTVHGVGSVASTRVPSPSSTRSFAVGTMSQALAQEVPQAMMPWALPVAEAPVGAPSVPPQATPQAKPWIAAEAQVRSQAAAGHRWTGQAAQPAELTTVIMRNLPNNYTRDLLQGLLDFHGFNGRYDLIYFPIDFKTHAAMGYAFVNLVSTEDAQQFGQHFEGFSQWLCQSRKICSVTWSNPHQGWAAHVERYRNSPLMHPSVPDGYRPAVFKNGVRVAFPTPTKKVKPPRQGMQRMLF